jgi:kanamycin kinase
MTLKPITPDIDTYPAELHPFLTGAKLYDSSGHSGESTIFMDKDAGYFLKSAPTGSLERSATMTRYFHGKGLTTDILAYISDDRDWLLTEKIRGDDCIAAKYLDQPVKLCDTLAERLSALHRLDVADCPVQNHTEPYLSLAEDNKRSGKFDEGMLPKCIKGIEEAWAFVEKNKHLLKNNTLLHGDFCLPNIILDDWAFSGFIDLGYAGVGDRHVDVFWGIWSLGFNLKTDKYRERFIEVYGRHKVDEDVLRLVAAIEVFG